jgi:hypothetical protein
MKGLNTDLEQQLEAFRLLKEGGPMSCEIYTMVLFRNWFAITGNQIEEKRRDAKYQTSRMVTATDRN